MRGSDPALVEDLPGIDDQQAAAFLDMIAQAGPETMSGAELPLKVVEEEQVRGCEVVEQGIDPAVAVTEHGLGLEQAEGVDRSLYTESMNSRMACASSCGL